jgi:predicted  nucleic acid-binding Zn-ribbon protein
MSEEKTGNLTPDEEELLMKLNNHDIKEINFHLTSEGIVYEDLEEITEKYNPAIFRRLLRSLEEKGILEQKDYQMVVFCPKCRSPEVYTKYACTKCKSVDIKRNDFIEHSHCGYIDDKSKFEKDHRFVCPNCDTDLGSVDEEPPESGKESYTIIGSSFKCNNCGNNFERPNIQHQCQGCGSSFNFKQSKYEKISSYIKTGRAAEMSPENRIQRVKDSIQDILSEWGVDVKYDTVLRGQSEGEHVFDVIGETKQKIILADISENGKPNDLITLFGKRVDVQTRLEKSITTILIDVSGNGEVGGLGDVYDIKILKSDDDFENNLNEFLGTIIEKKKGLFR